MKTRKEAILRLEFASGATGTKDDVGKFVTISDDGKTMSVVTSATVVPGGLITEVDGFDGVDGNGGNVALMADSGIHRMRLNATPGAIVFGSKLALCADGTVKLATGATGEIVVGKSCTKLVNAKGGQLIEGTLINQ